MVEKTRLFRQLLVLDYSRRFWLAFMDDMNETLVDEL